MGSGDDYVHGAIVHIDLIGDKVWIQYDGTEGIAADLVEAGIPKGVAGYKLSASYLSIKALARCQAGPRPAWTVSPIVLVR